MGIHTTRVYLAVLLQGCNAQGAVLNLCYQRTIGCFVVHVVLQLVVHPSGVLHLVLPVGSIQFRACLELVLPYQCVTFGGIVGRLLGSGLSHCDVLTGSTRHNDDVTCTLRGIRVLVDGHSHRIVSILSRGFHKVAIGINTPLFSSGGNVNCVAASCGRCIDALLRYGDRWSSGLWVIATPTAASKDCGEREQ